MKAAAFLERLALALFSMGLIAYVLIEAKLWASDLQVFFLRVGDLKNLVILSIAILLFAKLLERFLRWEINFLLPHRRRKQ